MSRVFFSHSSRDSRQAVAVQKWLIEQQPGLAEEIFLDLDPHTGIRPGERWRQKLQEANARCEAVICLLPKQWEASRECHTEFRYAENLGKTILCARLEPLADTNITSEWQRCDLLPDHGPTTEIDIGMGGSHSCWQPTVYSGCWTPCAPWGSGPSASHGRRRVIPTAPAATTPAPTARAVLRLRRWRCRNAAASGDNARFVTGRVGWALPVPRRFCALASCAFRNAARLAGVITCARRPAIFAYPYRRRARPSSREPCGR